MRLPVLCGVAAVSVALAGCSVGTTEATYNDSLIRQVGDGSMVEAGLVHALSAEKSLGPFSDPTLEAPMKALMLGELNKLSEHDLRAIDHAGIRSRERVPQAQALFKRLASQLESSHIDPNRYRALSSGAQRFIAAWNESLLNLASAFRKVGHDFSFVVATSGEFHSLLVAASEATSSRLLARYRTIRERYFHKLFPVVEEMTGLTRSATAGTFTKLLNTNREARIIVEKVNERYPHGELAEQFTRR